MVDIISKNFLQRKKEKTKERKLVGNWTQKWWEQDVKNMAARNAVANNRNAFVLKNSQKSAKVGGVAILRTS